MNNTMPDILVVNQKDEIEGEYIGRGSPLGNPFSHMGGTSARWVVSSRGEAIQQFEAWLEQQIQRGNTQVCDELNRLAEKALNQGTLKLRCFCKPLPCHGDVIKRVLDEALKEHLNQEEEVA